MHVLKTSAVTPKHLARALAAVAILGIMLAMMGSTVAKANIQQLGPQKWGEDFEGQTTDWWTVGGAGFDHGLGFAHTGLGNGWVRNTQGWNAINTTFPVTPQADCMARAWIRVAPTLTDGYMTVLGEDYTVRGEVRLTGATAINPGRDYNFYSFHFNPGYYGLVRFHFGMWGNGQDSWATIDDLIVSCGADNSSASS